MTTLSFIELVSGVTLKPMWVNRDYVTDVSNDASHYPGHSWVQMIGGDLPLRVVGKAEEIVRRLCRLDEGTPMATAAALDPIVLGEDAHLWVERGTDAVTLTIRVPEVCRVAGGGVKVALAIPHGAWASIFALGLAGPE